jgi:hypothetical protein
MLPPTISFSSSLYQAGKIPRPAHNVAHGRTESLLRHQDLQTRSQRHRSPGAETDPSTREITHRLGPTPGCLLHGPCRVGHYHRVLPRSFQRTGHPPRATAVSTRARRPGRRRNRRLDALSVLYALRRGESDVSDSGATHHERYLRYHQFLHLSMANV